MTKGGPVRGVIWLLLLFVLAAISAETFGLNDGLVSIYWAPYRIVLGLNLAIVLLLAVLLLGFALIRASTTLVDLPRRAQAWRSSRRELAAQAALRESLSYFFAARYTRAYRSARRAMSLHEATPELSADAESLALMQLLAAHSLHRLQDRSRRDAAIERVRSLVAGRAQGATIAEGAHLLAVEWALDDRDASRAMEELAVLSPGVGRRTQALRLRLQAARLAREPLEALHTARLLAKHQGFAPLAAQGLLRSLALEAIESGRDFDQVQRIWSELEPSDRRDPMVVARAVECAAGFGNAVDARSWFKPHWEQISSYGELERTALAQAFVLVLEGLPADWLGILEAAVDACPQDPMVSYAAGAALIERQLWGRARRLLEFVAGAAKADPVTRVKAWRALGHLAEKEGDTDRAQICFDEVIKNA
jgi:HemY protein